MEKQYKYFKSDFRLLVAIDTKYKGPDDRIVSLDTTSEFEFRFYTTNKTNPYICSSTGGNNPVLKNCNILDDNKVMCNFNRAELELGPGQLMLEAEFIIPDADFSADGKNNVVRLYTTSLVLTTDADKDSEGDHTEIPLLIDCLRGEGIADAGLSVEEGMVCITFEETNS